MRPRLSALTARIDVERVRRGRREAALISAQHSEGDRLRLRDDGVGRRHDEGTGLQGAGRTRVSCKAFERQTRKQQGENTRSTFDESGASERNANSRVQWQECVYRGARCLGPSAVGARAREQCHRLRRCGDKRRGNRTW